MKWDFVEKLIDKNAITEFEQAVGYTFPKRFKEHVKRYNGGCPKCNVFDTDVTEGRVFNNLLSFNKEDEESIWDEIGQDSEWGYWEIEGLDEQYIPFARDPFGNYICFDRSNDHVVLFDHEELDIEEIAPDFSTFMSSLYEDDDEDPIDLSPQSYTRPKDGQTYHGWEGEFYETYDRVSAMWKRGGFEKSTTGKTPEEILLSRLEVEIILKNLQNMDDVRKIYHAIINNIEL